MSQDKLKEKESAKYLETHVNPILKPLMVSILKSKTDHVCDFIVDWIKT
jgi:hypothetical protein